MMITSDQIKLVNLQLSRLIESSRNVMLIQGEALSIADPIIKTLVVRAFENVIDQIIAVTDAVDELAESGKIYSHAIEQYNIAVLIDDVVNVMQQREERVKLQQDVADAVDDVMASVQDLQAAAESKDLPQIMDILGIEIVVESQEPQGESLDASLETDDIEDDEELSEDADESDGSDLDQPDSAVDEETIGVGLYMEIDLSSIDDSSDSTDEDDDHFDGDNDEDADEEMAPEPPKQEVKRPMFSNRKQSFSAQDE